MRFERVKIQEDTPPTPQDINFLLHRRWYLLEPESVRAETRKRAENARPGSPLAKLAASGLYAPEQPGELKRLEPIGRCKDMVDFG